MKNRYDQWLIDELRGRTFDDFLNPPGWGKAKTRKGISLVSNFSQNVPLNLPIVSANMDTVTGARMAVVMAQEGGLGIIHRYLSVDDQCSKVREVKRKESSVIEQPHSIVKTATIGEARKIIEKHKVGCLMVIGSDGKLLGLLSSRDVRFASDEQLISERMTPREKLITASPSISLSKARNLLDKNRLEKLPLVGKDLKLVGLITSKDIENLERYPLANKDLNGQLIVGAAIGAVGDYLERSAELIKSKVDVLVMDIANFQSEVGREAVKNFRKKFPEAELVIGNIVLPEAVRVYQKLGVNGLKVGLGPGSACTTRYNTNIGVAQAQAIYDCARVSEIPIVADGGVKRHGHIALALLLGSSSVMVGGLFAGTSETPGLVFRDSNGKKVKIFRGMASREAMYERLRTEEADDPYEISSRMSPEGIERKVEYKGSVVPIIKDIAGHLTSTISYLGGMSLKEAKEIFTKNPQKYIIRISAATQRESWDR